MLSMSYRRVAAVAAVAAAAIAVAVPLALRASSAQNTAATTPAAIRAQFTLCADGEITPERTTSLRFKECISQVFQQSVKAGQLANLGLAIVEQTELTPVFSRACHDAGHAAGQTAYALKPDIVVLLDQPARDTCMFGLGHGFIDGFGLSYPDDDEYMELVRACEALQPVGKSRGSDIARGYCSDGAGHAAWISTRDPQQAFTRCGFFPDAFGRALCGEGVVMDMYEPAGIEASRTLADADRELVDLCAGLTEFPDGVSTGCANGAAYIYTRPMWKLNASWVGSGEPLPVSIELRDELDRQARSVAQRCEAHGDLSDDCFNSFSKQLPLMALKDKPLREKLCVYVSGYEQACRNREVPLA